MTVKEGLFLYYFHMPQAWNSISNPWYKAVESGKNFMLEWVPLD
jgi:hypothetical protein